MAQIKFDGIIQAARIDESGQVKWVRAYLRRGPTWSDHTILERQDLIDRIKSGKRFAAGKRIPQMATTFEITDPISLLQANGREVLVTGEIQSDQDCLEGVPLL